MSSQSLSDKKNPHGAVSPVETSNYIDPKEERALVWRLDIFFLTVAFLGYAFKYLDQTNISNAYVSGMKTDLHIVGNEYNYFTTFFNIGYMVMLYPSCIIISHIGPSVWLPACEVYGLRFLIGLCEGATWPGYFTIISQWYLPHEMALRMSVYNIAQPVGAMLSGSMQGGLSTHLDGALGRAGWRWAFIINGVITIFVAIVAFFVLPGFPERQNPFSKFYLSARDIEIAQDRNRRVGRMPQIGITPKTFLRTFKFWHVWIFAIAWSIGTGTTPSNYFNLWLESLTNSDGTAKYSTAMLDYLPIAGQAIQLVAELLFSGFSDYFGVRLPFLLIHAAINVLSLIILIIRPSSESFYMAGWYLNYVGA
ncbi:Major facilitator superfamily domain general substrate transporter [Penicillium malachiteum]|uniref:Major facilitator superfamily domain general substrate transporter n=1 Tax=Penicillium malachiteum TaxID=1324776 RepID=A0AAD6HST5_9EURO|nr:Major facilitator superfamily domain general substrate transporter [Penicillium malachiteum]